MDDKLQQVLRVRPLQEEVITFRNNMKLYRTIMKETCLVELKKITNVDINVAQIALKLPDLSKMPPIPKSANTAEMQLDGLISDVDITLEAIDLL